MPKSIEAAQRNDYLWNNLLSPVEYVNLELVFAATGVARTFDLDLGSILPSASVAAIPLQLARPIPRSLRSL